MITIPSAWKVGANRDNWYNNQGTPIWFIRIVAYETTLRISNEKLTLHETDVGWAQYDNRFFDSLNKITMALNFLKGKAGATGQMGQTDLKIANGIVDGVCFKDEYNMDEFINAEVDIWYAPKEASPPYEQGVNVMRVYKGIVTNAKENPKTVTLTINENSNTKHKKVPLRYDEFNVAHSTGWTIPEENIAKVMPISFGEGIFKAYHCDTTDNGTRYYFIGYTYKDIRTSFRTVLYYWEPNEKRYKVIDSAKWTELSYLGGDLKLIRFDVSQLAIYSEMANYLIPSVYVYMHNGLPLALNGDKLADKKKATTSDASNTRARDVSGGFSIGVWESVYNLTFKKTQFDLRGNFDLYIVADVSYENSGAVKRWETRFTWDGNTVTQDHTMYDDDGGAPPHYYCAWIPEEWLNEGYNPNETPASAGLLKKNVSPNDLNALNHILCQLKPLTNPITINEAYTYEASLMQVMLSLPKDMYVKDGFLNNNPQSLIEFIFNQCLNIPSTDIVFDNFIEDHKVDGQIFEEIDSYELFAKIANELGFIFYEDQDSKERFIDIAPGDSVYEITDSDIVRAKDKSLMINKCRTSQDVFSAFFVDYCKQYATGDYQASKYVTKDAHNLGHIDSTLMQQLCQDAHDYYRSEKRLTVKLDYIRDSNTAETILAKLVQFYSRKRVIVAFIATPRIIDLELGDQVRINTSFYSSSQNFYIAGKDIDPKTGLIEYIAFETPWDSSGLVRDMESLERINESSEVWKLVDSAACQDQEAINETEEHGLI